MTAWFFGDGFDLYQAASDAYQSYWDTGNSTILAFSKLGGGRFSNSRAITWGSNSASTAGLVKSSGSNDAIHHIVVAYEQTGLTASNLFYFTLLDGTNAQCSVVFKGFNGSAADIILTSGGPIGTTLDTYSGPLTAINTWFAFEFEIVINNTTGSWAIRKNGNTVNDHSASSLNTRGGSSNNYANKLNIGSASSASNSVDDLLWRSDPSSVPWVGDIRCFTRLPAADSSVQFTPSATSPVAVTPYVQGATQNISNGTARYSPFVATCSGTVGSVVLSLGTGFTGNMKCTLFNDSSGAAGTIVGSATTVTNPVTSNNTFTFSSPPSVTQGTIYWLGFDSDTATTNGWNTTANTSGYQQGGASSSTAYASFPVASPSLASTTQQPLIFTINITPTTTANANMVAELIEDQALTYVSDSTVGHADFYTPQAISATPSSVVGVVTRAFCQKSDAGTRNIALQIKSGATTSTGTSTALATSWNWIYKVDQVDPNTSAAWTATAVDNATFGPSISA